MGNVKVEYKESDPAMLPVLQHPIERLTTADRCSKGACGAQAYWGVKLHEDNEVLLFCFHHSYEVEELIMALNPYAVRDARNDLIMDESLVR